MTKEKRIQQFLKLQDSISTINLDYSVPEVIKPNEIKNIKKNLFVKNISFFHGNVLEIMQSCPEAVILVFCSSKNPGGGVLRGSKAQEEDISLHSTWYFQVKELTDFYLEKHSSAINTDNLIFWMFFQFQKYKVTTNKTSTAGNNNIHNLFSSTLSLFNTDAPDTCHQ